MNEVVAIVEGQTEQTFVRDQLAAHLGLHGATIWAVLPGRTRKQGGVKAWDIAKADRSYGQILWTPLNQAARCFSPSVNVTPAITS